MKALSLWQPWATLVIVARKHETRSWGTSYRGDVLICSTAKTAPEIFQRETTDPKIYERMKCALFHDVRTDPRSRWSYPTSYPDGSALGVVELFDCLPASEWKSYVTDAEQEYEIDNQRAMGDVDSPGRFVWLFRRPRIFASPVKITGGQRLWNPGGDRLAKIMPSLVGLDGQRCRTCGSPAQCVGRYETSRTFEFSCGYHCGHSCEDGVCYQLAAAVPV